MNFRIKARYRIFSLKIAKAVGISSKVIRSLLSSFISNYFFNAIYFPLLAYSLLVNYMSENDFFSYDLLSDSFFAINLFVLAMIAGLMVTMLAIFSSGILFYANKKGYDVPFKSYWPLFLVNCLFALLFILIIFGVQDKSFPFFVLGICAYMAIHYSIFIFGDLKTKIISLTLLLIISIGFVFTQPSASSKVFGNGLRAFGVGGNIPVVIYDESTPKGYEAKLLMATPTVIYFKIKDKTGFVPMDKLNRIMEH